VNRIVPKLETDQHAVLAGLPAAGEPQRDERGPVLIFRYSGGVGAVVLDDAFHHDGGGEPLHAG
jgi:hypothetical protein